MSNTPTRVYHISGTEAEYANIINIPILMMTEHSKMVYFYFSLSIHSFRAGPVNS